MSGGLETTVMTLVAGSVSRASIPANVEMPPMASVRSRLPVPMPFEIPEPAWWIRLENSCMPVPEDPTIPMGPRRTAFVKPRPAPPR